MLAIGDIFDAITSRRHYRDRMEFIRVMRVLDEESQGHIQPEFLEAFKSLTISQIMVIMEQDNIKPVESEDLELFKKYSLGELQRILEADESEEGISEAEEHLLDRFDFYYHRSISKGWVPD